VTGYFRLSQVRSCYSMLGQDMSCTSGKARLGQIVLGYFMLREVMSCYASLDQAKPTQQSEVWLGPVRPS
jgi:hypothetical protein